MSRRAFWPADEHRRVLDREQLKELARRGHEIGCHTYSHVKVQTLCDEQRRKKTVAESKLDRNLPGLCKIENFALSIRVVSMLTTQA